MTGTHTHGTNSAVHGLPVVLAECSCRTCCCRCNNLCCVVSYLSVCVQAFYKSARVEWVPVGVVGAIVPWNWPFHNIINPISAAVMSGNAIVIKVCVLLIETEGG